MTGDGPAREFLGWDQPALVSACDHLALRTSRDGELDLSHLLVVVQGGRAGRTLLSMLAERAEGVPFSPPTILTPGEIAHALLPIEGEPAGPLARRLAWVSALESLAPDDLEAICPRVPDRDAPRAWADLARVLERAHNELTGEAMRFEDVSERGSSLPGFVDDRRWLAAGRAQQLYQQRLNASGLIDPPLAVLDALRQEAPLRDRVLVLVGVHDLNQATRSVLERAGPRVTALVFAPEADSDAFDRFGCPIPEQWGEREIELDDDRIVFAEDPTDEAQRTLGTIAQLEGAYAPQDIIVGVPDPEVASRLRNLAPRYGPARFRDAAGVDASSTPPGALLDAVASYLERRSFRSFAELVRHPDVERLLVQTVEPPEDKPGSCEWWLDALDRFAREHVPAQIDPVWRVARSKDREVLAPLSAAIDSWLAPLDGNEARPFAHWPEPIVGVMLAVYGDVELSDDDDTARLLAGGCKAATDCARELGALTEAQGGSLTCVGHQAVRMVLDAMSERAVAHAPDPNAIEMLGWLELAIDPAPVAIVTGVNEGKLPAAVTTDPLLPDALRKELGLRTSDDRFGREAYLMTALVRSRPEVTLVCARRSADGDPLLPSRLLFRCDEQRAVERIERSLAPAPPSVAVAPVFGPGTDAFERMPIVDAPTPESMSVTSFRTYLASPYQFYIEQVLDLREADDADVELSPSAFGLIIHRVLQQFGEHEIRDEPDADAIESFLHDALERRVFQLFGPDPPTAVWLQAEIAKKRLSQFAEWQAAWRAEGWRITHTEWSPKGVTIDVDGVPMGIRGTIDRVDVHESGERAVIFDYKTGEDVTKPGSAHRARSGEWRDLQLPLYLRLCGSLDLPSEIRLGYIAITKKASVHHLIDDWDDGVIASAYDAAAQVVRDVRSGAFDDAGSLRDDARVLLALCGMGFIGGEDDE